MVDKSDLRRVILSTVDQFAEGFSIAQDITVSQDFNKVVISGMGGSALHADVLRCYLDDFFVQESAYPRIQIVQNRSYILPPESYDRCLNIVCSHSGNTEETIASFEQILEKNLPCVGISAGGVIEKMCQKNGVQHVKLPIPYENFQPRMATGNFVAAILQILITAQKIPDCTTHVCDHIVPQIYKDIVSFEENAKVIAQNLVGKTPIIYASEEFKSLAMVWKIKINENSKVPAFWNYFPELNHNEFVGFTNAQAQFAVMILRNAQDHPRNLLRFDATADALRVKGISVDIIDIVEGDMLRKLFSTIGLCDWISYYLALAYEQDPTPVDMVEDFKKVLTEKGTCIK